MSETQQLQNQINELEKQINVTMIGLATKVNGLKRLLSDTQINEYNDYVLDQLTKAKPVLEKLLTPEELDNFLKTSLK
jgi:uncharacterized protein YpuA (DUF1002 family)